jgi:PAS domain S-box-containing protein
MDDTSPTPEDPAANPDSIQACAASGVTADPTVRKRSEDAPLKSRNDLGRVMDAVRDFAIIIADSAGIISGWNTGAAAMFGFSEEEAIGMPGAAIFTPEDCEAGVPEQEMRGAREKGHAADERWHIRKSGARFWVSGAMFPLYDEGVLTGYVKVARDLTEHRLSEAAVRDSEARFRILADALPQLVWTNDADGQANYFNRRWFDYTGLSLEELEGPGWQAVVHPEDAGAALGCWTASLEKAEIFDTSFRLRGASGEFRWFIARNIPLRDEAGQVTGWFGTATDVEAMKLAETALVQSEDRLRLAHGELELRVQERTQALSKALDLLREEAASRREIEEHRHELLRRLVATQEEERRRISRELHDNLSQHMVAVKFGLDRLQREVESHGGPSLPESFRQLGGLVDQLIKAAHRQAWELRPAELDHLGLEAALERYVEDWSRRTEIPVEFISEGDGRLSPEVEIAFYRVVQEALTNVARHADCTTVCVTLGINSCSHVSISDNGRGMDTGLKTGRLGLLGMRERMAVVGGTLELESAPGKGTIVRARAGHSERTEREESPS